MKTIEIYEKAETVTLQSLLREYEQLSEDTEILIDDAVSRDEKYDNLRKISDDYEIDISLIRMELNRRLWCETIIS